MDVRASLFHGTTAVDPGPSVITLLQSHCQGKQAPSGDDDDFDQFVECMTPTPSKSSVCQSVPELVEENNEHVGQRVSFGGPVVAETHAKHPNKRWRREEGIPEMIFASAQMEKIIAKTMRKMMMRKSKPAATRPTRGSQVEPMALIKTKKNYKKSERNKDACRGMTTLTRGCKIFGRPFANCKRKSRKVIVIIKSNNNG